MADVFSYSEFSIEISVDNSVDPDQTPHLRRRNWVCTVC